MAIKKQHISPLDLNPDIAVGLSLPLANAKNGGFALNYTTLDQAKTNLRNLLKTNWGERYMQPEFGADLISVLFEPNTIERGKELKEKIEDAVKKWLPYVTINTFDMSQREHEIKLDLTFYINEDKWNTDSITLIIESPEPEG